MSDAYDDIGLVSATIGSTTNLVFTSSYVPPFVQIDVTQFTVVAIGFGGGLLSVVEEVPPRYIRGKVLNFDGLPARRKVFACDRETGALLGSAESSADDGFFVLRPRADKPVVIFAIPLDSEKINAVVLDNILPVPD